ncbi:MAG: hypothetical protein WDN04_16940 [Rhodospirillales bacterium]
MFSACELAGSSRRLRSKNPERLRILSLRMQRNSQTVQSFRVLRLLAQQSAKQPFRFFHPACMQGGQRRLQSFHVR